MTEIGQKNCQNRESEITPHKKINIFVYKADRKKDDFRNAL